MVNNFNRLAKEGRKFGLSLVVSTQRPSEVSDTVISQCSNFILHRIVNAKDLEFVVKMLPDSSLSLVSELPLLPARRALVMGTSVEIPTLVNVQELSPAQLPNSNDIVPSRDWALGRGEGSTS